MDKRIVEALINLEELQKDESNCYKTILPRRKALGLTAEELGKRVEVTKQTICNLERGRTPYRGPVKRVIEMELNAKKGDRTWEEVINDALVKMLTT